MTSAAFSKIADGLEEVLQTSQQPEVTEEMVEAAGAVYLASLKSDETWAEIFTSIYRAMHLHRPLSEEKEA